MSDNVNDLNHRIEMLAAHHSLERAKLAEQVSQLLEENNKLKLLIKEPAGDVAMFGYCI